MKILTLYIESSIFGFYYDEKLENISKKEAVRTLLEQIDSGLFRAFTSPLTVKELTDAPPPYKDKLLELIKTHKIETVEIDEEESENLFQKYIDAHIVPDEFKNDARHVAYATIIKVDVLVSLNLQHIANEWSSRQFNAVNIREGYSSLMIRTPEEVVYYGD